MSHVSSRSPLRHLVAGRRVALLVLVWSLLWLSPLPARDLLRDWPHWAADQQTEVLWLERFIDRWADRHPVALFDFDGTLISERYAAPDGKQRSGQSTWRVWGAGQLERFPDLFPRWRLGFNTAEDRAAMRLQDNLLEGQTNVEAAGYMKFAQLATFEGGMTPAEVTRALDACLEAYPPAAHAFLPMLDLVQRMCDRGFRVWIVSGSSPLYIHTVLRQIERTTDYRPGQRYRFTGLVTDSWEPRSADHPQGSRIIGNIARLDAAGRFSQVYDGRFCDTGDGRLFVIEGEGKRRVLEHWIAPVENAPAVFCAGNSDGDADLLAHVLGGSLRHGGLLVNPRGKTFPGLAGPRVHAIRAESERGGE